jgi:hypothetical protein
VNAPVNTLVAPIGAVTLTFLAPNVAPAVIQQFALTVLAVDVMPVQVMPPQEIVTAVVTPRLSSKTGSLYLDMQLGRVA